MARFRIPRTPIVILLAILAASTLSIANAIPFLHVAGDADGDHRVAVDDAMPAVFCAESHANVSGDNSGVSWSIGAPDLALLAGAAFDEPPASPLADQNHNDVGDFLDFMYVLQFLPGTYTAAGTCGIAVADPLPLTGIGATDGAPIELIAPVYVSGGEGTVTVALRTNAVAPDAYIGYFARVTFDETIVQATSVKTDLSSFPGTVCGSYSIIDNSNDVAGPDGSTTCAVAGIGSATAAAQPLLLLTFDVIAPGAPQFCIRSAGAPDSANAAYATYTVGADMGAQAQTLAGICGRAETSVASTGSGMTAAGASTTLQGSRQVVSLTLPARATGPVTTSYAASDASCAGGGIATPNLGPATGLTSWTYASSFIVPGICTPGSTLTSCTYVSAVLESCHDDIVVAPSGELNSAVDAAIGVPGATVTLEDDDGLGFGPPEPGEFSPIINPQLSLIDGNFGWDLLPGTYQVVITKTGCAPVTSATDIAPPPVFFIVPVVCPDADGDGFANLPVTLHSALANANPAVDNCTGFPNPGQANNDGNFIDITPPEPLNDVTLVHSDAAGNDCDPDDDNDGLPDATELGGPPCATATAATDPTLADTDGDLQTDNAECVLGFDPAAAASVPPAVIAPDADGDGLPNGLEITLGTASPDPDTDDDGLLDGVEFRRYGSNPLLANTDGDNCGDGREAASVNGDLVVNVLDLARVAAHTGPAPGPPYLANMDYNKSGVIDVIDLLGVAQRAGTCTFPT